MEYFENIQFIALPFVEVSLSPSYVHGMHLGNDSSDSFADDDEQLAKKKRLQQVFKADLTIQLSVDPSWRTGAETN